MFSVELPISSPEWGNGFTFVGHLSRREIGSWLYGISAAFDSYYERWPEHRRKAEAVRGSFVQFDFSARDMRSAEQSRTRDGYLTHHGRLALDDARAQRIRASRRLGAFTSYGLERRVGERLEGGDENVFLHLTARRFGHGRLRVCEQCTLVFEAPRAVRCPSCRRHPVRINVRPASEGGWHVDYRVGERFVGDAFDGTVHYMTVCSGCGRRFETTRSDRRHCRNCGGNSGRVRRHRGGSRTGRQSFRYVHDEGAPDWAVGFQDLNGEAVNLTATEGFIETDDAEIARHLDSLPSTRRLDPDGQTAFE